MLKLVFKSFFSLDKAQAAALHHYSKSFQGFSAKLTPEQAKKLAGIKKFNDTLIIIIIYIYMYILTYMYNMAVTH